MLFMLVALLPLLPGAGLLLLPLLLLPGKAELPPLAEADGPLPLPPRPGLAPCGAVLPGPELAPLPLEEGLLSLLPPLLPPLPLLPGDGLLLLPLLLVPEEAALLPLAEDDDPLPLGPLPELAPCGALLPPCGPGLAPPC